MSKMPISFKKAAGVTSISHNNRDFEEKDWENEFHSHIDRERTPDNVIIKQEHVRDAYERIFGEALEKYNDKQKRKDRKIDDYYDHVKNSKTLHTQYEFIVQVGKKEDFENSPENWETANEILLEYVEEFQERNPNFEVYNAVIHNDEASPHLHLNVIPVAEGYKRGLERQPAFNRALENQGVAFDKDSRTIFRNFREQEINGIEQALNEKGIERLKVGTNQIKDHHEYKKVMREVENKRLERSEIESEVNTLINTKNVLETKIQPLQQHIKSIEERVTEVRAENAEESETFAKQKQWQKNFSGASALGNTMQELKKYKAYVPRKNALGVTVPQEEPRLVSIRKEDYDSYDTELTRAHQARLIAERRVDEERSEKEEAEKFANKFLQERNQQTENANYWMDYSDDLEKENKELKRENTVLQEKVSKIDKAFENLHETIERNIPEGKVRDWLQDAVSKTKTWIDERQPPQRTKTRDRDEWER